MENKNLTWLGLAVLVVMGWALLWPVYRSGPPVQPASRAKAKPQALKKPTFTTGVFKRMSTDGIPDSVRPIMGLHQENMATRLKAVKALGKNLTRAEIEALFAFLLAPGQKTFSLQNDVIHALRQQATPPDDLLPVLRDLHRDSQQDLVSRDYALQHLVAEYQKNTTNAVAHQIPEVLWEALGETNSSIAGTALLGLHRLCDVDPSLDSNQVSQAALQLTQEGATGELARITALQVCAQRGLQEALPTARALAREGASLALRISAIAAVGDLGGKDEKEFLQLLSAQGAAHLQPAITSALQRLQRRLIPSTSIL